MRTTTSKNHSNNLYRTIETEILSSITQHCTSKQIEAHHPKLIPLVLIRKVNLLFSFLKLHIHPICRWLRIFARRRWHRFPDRRHSSIRHKSTKTRWKMRIPITSIRKFYGGLLKSMTTSIR